jgi:four helix bundle protein
MSQAVPPTRDPRVKPTYDLMERTAAFGEAVIRFARSLPRDEVVRPLTSQVIRSSTSVGANYMEADGAGSRKDFAYKVALCRKEAKETTHWLRMISVACPASAAPCQELSREAHELALIFSSIIRKCQSPRGEETPKAKSK